MKSDARVAAPPSKPVMIWDGDCRFCGLWIKRWGQETGDRVEYIRSQDASVVERFPELTKERLATSVHLVETDGHVYTGSEAVFRGLAANPERRGWLRLYRNYDLFAEASEGAYGFVARNRTLFSWLTRVGWGQHTERPEYFLTRAVFLRAMGLIYLVAFVSLWVQIAGLVGHDGILPAQRTMAGYRAEAAQEGWGVERFWRVPTFCWLDASDRCLNVQCAAGTVLAVLVIIGIAPAPCLFLLWAIYLSLSNICPVFLDFQWDLLLLETGFLAIFFAPLTLLPRNPFGGSRSRRGEEVKSSDAISPQSASSPRRLQKQEAPPSRLVLWLLRLLLFKLMFASGCVKLLSGDPLWHNLTALTVHYETQPLPTWIGWWTHQLPVWFQEGSCAGMFAIELGAPFLIFLPRRPRFAGCCALAGLQVLILLTGNYTFFNWLTLALCVLLLDDFAIRGVLCICSFSKKPSASSSAVVPQTGLWRDRPQPAPPLGEEKEKNLRQSVPSESIAGLHTFGGQQNASSPLPSPPSGEEREKSSMSNDSVSPPARKYSWSWPSFVIVPLAIVAISISLFQLLIMFQVRTPLLQPFAYLNWRLSPMRSFNNYGLFAMMTNPRLEIIVEGSNDGTTWLPYEFKYKPGDMDRRLAFVAPHQPRLDWQMWFAALGTYRDPGNQWFLIFCVKLLEGSPPVLGLLEKDPFPEKPPLYIRAELYEYHFTTPQERRNTGNWWRREPKGDYLPPFSLKDLRGG